MPKCYSIILAAGSGSRMKNKTPKQFVKVFNKTILEHTIEKFEACKLIDYIILVCHPQYMDFAKGLFDLNSYKKIIGVLPGGQTRRESSYIGLKTMNDSNAFVLIHDAVRPFVSIDLIERCISSLKVHDVVYPAVPSEDTLITVDESMILKNIPLRSSIMRGQTPQGFKYNVIIEAHKRALNDYSVDKEVTNDCGLVYRYKLADINAIQGDRYNFKITHEEDIFFANSYIKSSLNKEG